MGEKVAWNECPVGSANAVLLEQASRMLEKLDKKLDDEITKLEKKIGNEISHRIRNLEKWMWGIGGGIVFLSLALGIMAAVERIAG